MSTHLVTGGSGFLGNLIARRLLEEGHKVKVLDIWHDVTQPSDIEFIQADIRDEQAVLNAMKNVEYVHHNVALVPLTKSGRTFWDVNVNGSDIASKCARKSGVQNFIHMSSSAIYGAPKQLPITDTTPTSPLEIYGRGKLAGEISVKSNLSNWDGNLVVIRPRTILGPGRLGIFQILFEWIAEDKNIYTIGSGENLFQFVHAYDLMSAYMLAIKQNKSLTLNVGTEKFGTLNETFHNLIDTVHSKSQVKHLPATASITALKVADNLKLSPLAPWHYLTYHKPFYFDLTPLKEIGWFSKYSNDDMFLEAFLEFKTMNMSDTANLSPHRKHISGQIINLLKKFS